MKADLTLPKVREAFRALYVEQRVMTMDNGTVYKLHPHNLIGEYVLSLRHISSLTEEEIGVLARIEDCYDEIQPARIDLDFGFPVYRRWDDYVRPLSIDSYDFLRSIGILIPYRGNSCEELIAANLAVYRKEGE